MLVRVLQFIIGAILAGGGGYLAWTWRESAANLFPPPPAGLPLVLIAGLLGLTSGIVFLVSAVHPRPNRRRALAERTAREAAALGEAEAYYGGRSDAADRDWRSGDITPLAPPQPAAAPQPGLPPISVQPTSPAITDVEAPVMPRALSTPPPPAKPVASSEPVGNGASPFPSAATLSPLPRALEPPPAPAPGAAKPASAPAPAADDPHAPIRAAISAGRLDEAYKMLAAARDSATGLDLALLTALAGDHALVSGRQSHAKWLWRLALKRFGELGALDSPTARAVAESLRQAG